MQVNPDNSFTECGNIFIIQIEYTANKNRETLSQPKPWCNDSSVLNVHRGYYTTDVKEVVLSQPSVVEQINQSENRNSYSVSL